MKKSTDEIRAEYADDVGAAIVGEQPSNPRQSDDYKQSNDYKQSDDYS